MDFTYPPELDEFRNEIRAWLEQHLTGEFLELGNGEDLGADTWPLRCRWEQEMGAGGWIGLEWPKAYGGREVSAMESLVFAEEYARAGGPTRAGTFGEGLIGPTLVHFGSDMQKERFLGPILRGEEIWCQGFSEPGAGSDLASLSCRAVPDGDRWILNGQKVWSSNAHIAPWGFAICRTDVDVPKHAGMTAFLVPLQHDGVVVRGIRQMNGGASFNEVFFSDAVIPDEYRIGAVGDGWKVALAVLSHERNSSGGSGRRGGDFNDLLGLAVATGRTTDPLIRQGLARVYSRQRVREWARFRAAASVRLGGSAGPEGSIGKLLWTNAMQEISALASSMLGPALTADTGEWGTYGWNDHVLGAPGYRIAGGSDEIQKNIIGERVLGLPGEPRVDRGVPFKLAPR